jgi:CRISPR-associated protein Cmr3
MNSFSPRGSGVHNWKKGGREMDHLITVTPRDPIIARDSRPFGKGQGNRMRSLGWPMPSTLAGSLRTMLGNLSGGFTSERVERLKKISISGPLPFTGGELYLPCPGDSYAVKDGGKLTGYSLRPLEMGDKEGCDLPKGLLPPVPEWQKDDLETESFPPFWSTEKIVKWMLKGKEEDFRVPEWEEGSGLYPEGFIGFPPMDERTHVEIDPLTGASSEGVLFSTTGLDFTRDDHTADRRPSLSMMLRVETDDTEFLEILNGLNAMNTLGGERRLSFWRHEPEGSNWSCPDSIRKGLTNAGNGKIRMTLATPAVFSDGWKPGWIDSSDLKGTVPGTDVEVRLVSAIVRPWKPLAGWSYEKGKRGPKPIRRLVPAGTVYFMEVIKGDPLSLADLWLKPVSDGEQDRRDGYGLSLWGTWE